MPTDQGGIVPDQRRMSDFSRDDERMKIYTSDSRMIAKLHKLLRTDLKNRKIFSDCTHGAAKRYPIRRQRP